MDKRTKQPSKMQTGALLKTTIRGMFQTIGPVAPSLMGKLAYKLWFTPRRYRRPGWEQEIASKADQTYVVTAQGREVPVWAWGQGPTVLLVHGWEGRGTQLGTFIQPLLERGMRVVCFDAPAHGDARGSMTNPDEIRALIQAIANRENGLHSVITHSFGAIPTSFALREGLDLKRAVFICPPSELNEMLGFFQRMLAVPDKVMANLRNRIEKRMPHLGKRLWHELSTHVSARHFQMPGMVVHDQDDNVVPINQARKISDNWDSAMHLETQGLGHRKILKDPSVVAQVAHFLDERQSA